MIESYTPSIMIVDDAPKNLELLAGMLSQHGYNPRPVPNGSLALRSAEVDPPDLILLDINMPGMDGVEVCRRLKDHPQLKHTPVIFVTACIDTESKIRALESGGVDYITKPFQVEEVHARIKTHLRVRHLQLEIEAKNAELERNLERLRQLESLREALTSMVVHDLRSPLTGNLGYLRLLKGQRHGELNEEQGHYVDRAIQCTTSMVEMVSTVLDVSRLEENRMPVHRRRQDLAEIASRAPESLGALTMSRTVRFERAAEPIHVYCDGDLIGRVIGNLLGNAVKFTANGDEIIVDVRAEDDFARVSVTDSGPGIPAEYHQKIFEKFGQVETRQEGRKFSSGLGLAFCKLAVEAHGGEIGVESQVGKGSTFWFRLPMQRAAAKCG